MSNPNPYVDMPAKAFWRTAVADRNPLQMSELWDPKHRLEPGHRVATFGSCFAQHFGRTLKARGYKWFDAEPAPDVFDPAIRKKYNYGVFSARTGNIYTVAALKQWVSWALDLDTPPVEIWEAKGRFFDPFRPSIEPDGFASPEELLTSRDVTLSALRKIIRETNWYVFTLGLTEGWINRAGGYHYAMCPGTIAGDFDPDEHVFKNYNFDEIYRGLNWVLNTIFNENPRMKVLLTVSPVPLTATASGKHVLTATTYSKSVLRAVAGLVADNRKRVDYFPSFEIVTGTPFQGMFFEPNKRSVSEFGVTFVMNSFFACLEQKFGNAATAATGAIADTPQDEAGALTTEENELVCEEQMLTAFGRGAAAARA